MTTQPQNLRTGWTTGACAAAAAKAATTSLLDGRAPGTVTIVLPRGEAPVFQIEQSKRGTDWAEASIRKDAGDDPDVTHNALISARVERTAPGTGIVFRAGKGVGTVTKPGLPIGVGEPAINPVPRRMIDEAVAEVAAEHGLSPDFEITVSVGNGEELAKKTWNPRLGIVGGLSILGTTGIVRPFSCAAWIASIHRGIDVARASGLSHVLGATGATSEQAAQGHHALADIACLDMGDFAGGLLKYLRRNPIARLTISGGIGKLTKLAQGAMDLHSSRSQVDFAALEALAAREGLDHIGVGAANTALDALRMTGPGLALAVANEALGKINATLQGASITVDVMIVDRQGVIIAHVGDGASL